MLRYRKRIRLFAACLSALAGFVDAVGFLELGGFFVSFMSGNSTRLAVAAVHGEPLIAGGLIAAFVGGVTIGTLMAAKARPHHRPPLVLALVALLLAGAAALEELGFGMAGAAAMAMAMGAENGVFATKGEAPIGLTYMTGALVRVGQRVAAALRGEDPFGWAPFLLLWLGLIAGAMAGAAAYDRLGSGSLWLAAAGASGLAVTAGLLGARPEDWAP